MCDPTHADGGVGMRVARRSSVQSGDVTRYVKGEQICGVSWDEASLRKCISPEEGDYGLNIKTGELFLYTQGKWEPDTAHCCGPFVFKSRVHAARKASKPSCCSCCHCITFWTLKKNGCGPAVSLHVKEHLMRGDKVVFCSVTTEAITTEDIWKYCGNKCFKLVCTEERAPPCSCCSI